jgi:hypothetical protein
MTQKIVTIQIAEKDLDFLKDNNYQFCFAKKVNDSYNVVWQASGEYLENNQFSWIPHYQMFGTNTFQAGVQVIATTNTVDIDLGQQTTMSKEGVLSPAKAGGPTDSLTFNNNYNPIHPGVNAYTVGIDGLPYTTAIYVAESAIAPGSDTLTPVESVMVWFDQEVTTGTMFSSARSNTQEIDLTQTDVITYSYSNGQWSLGSLQAQSPDVQTILKITVATVTAVAATMLASKIASKLTGIFSKITVSGQAFGTGVVITYEEQKPSLGANAGQMKDLLDSASLVDILTGFTMEALASMGVGFTTLEADAQALTAAAS